MDVGRRSYTGSGNAKIAVRWLGESRAADFAKGANAARNLR
jgi:hypothetical protein